MPLPGGPSSRRSLSQVLGPKPLGRHHLSGPDLLAGPRQLGNGGRVRHQLERVLERREVVGLTSTAAGRPWRVTVIRSWCCSTRSTISENFALTAASGSVSDMTRMLVTEPANATSAPTRSAASVAPVSQQMLAEEPTAGPAGGGGRDSACRHVCPGQGLAGIRNGSFESYRESYEPHTARGELFGSSVRRRRPRGSEIGRASCRERV